MAAKNASNLAVRASSSGGQNNNISQDWTRFGKKQILSIGNKKGQRIHDGEDDDDIVGGIADAGDENHSSSDEEEGRTSAVKEKKRKIRRPTPVVARAAVVVGTNKDDSADGVVELAPSKKKKKKKGKKERAKENKEDAEPSKDTKADASIEKDGKLEEDPVSKSNNGTTAAIKTKEEDTNDNDTTNTNTSNNKRKYRKKVRSRQKNIRKDNRAANNKLPPHLIPGRSEYIGRPLTMETRKKLGLEEEDSKKTARSTDDGDPTTSVDKAFDSGEWVGGRGGDEKQSAETKHNAGEGGENVVLGKSGVSKQTTPKIMEKEEKGDNKNNNKASLTKIGDCIVGSSDAAAKPNDTNQHNDVGENISEKKGKKTRKKKRKFKNLVVG
ncbi:hypothetical protein ACHAXR_002435 [Thalassiosira sp. AJA248-18]